MLVWQREFDVVIVKLDFLGPYQRLRPECFERVPAEYRERWVAMDWMSKKSVDGSSPG